MTHSPANAPHAAVFAAAPDAAAAARYYAERLAMTTDPSDVAAELAAGDAGFVIVDSRNRGAWDEGHIPGALHLPTREIAERAAELIPVGTPVVVYCWSPGCNGGIRAALEFALAGHPVKELLGGFEYWVREGYEFETGDGGRHRHPVDARTGIAPGALAAGAAGGAAAGGATVACGC
ncbi:rhodanese-like domain-containing protein [Agromyces archimandritae]|uniref:Sulfurtransferase n=1 Tax=Agromyces archimandritae TaxID=2781962 RepID=A0A975FLQ7_9MICO|nr:rhodanese-like domain-containing protein [Agromyces archimandritae]QTX04052.1 sulfurtransferase [Agromyces archimandritae]